MNRYQRFFDEILRKTKSKEILWRQIHRRENSELIFNHNLVFRQFSAPLKDSDDAYKILLVEKKYDDPEEETLFEKYDPELIITDENGVVATLTDSVIDRSKIIELASLVELRNDKAQKLFGDD